MEVGQAAIFKIAARRYVYEHIERLRQGIGGELKLVASFPQLKSRHVLFEAA